MVTHSLYLKTARGQCSHSVKRGTVKYVVDLRWHDLTYDDGVLKCLLYVNVHTKAFFWVFLDKKFQVRQKRFIYFFE